MFVGRKNELIVSSRCVESNITIRRSGHILSRKWNENAHW